ncbi:DUF1330 domain-containing protein [Sphingomonas sp. LY54]|uniref:DUF1330 domain-containing protein n=1 Tax=Sphingomonadales TaxID=204457 RepID=UPI002ADEDF9A|nr:MULTISPECIES: DUF1330 domain-containing protein [Sphingomonadales]MEA1015264.1 DUF1330 domain-containing protein [Sphingosinicella sp. LY1275]WRP27707.1 DUF1330 domain-containing protein [Sphingomonas sp. LY54]
MPAYLIVAMTVQDASWREEYRAEAPAIVARFGGEYVAATPNVEIIEGDAVLPDMGAIIKFPDLTSLKGFISSDEYAPYKALRLTGSESIMYAFDA